MFNLFGNIETLSKSIMDLVNKLSTFTTSITSTLDNLVVQIEELVANVNEEISDDLDEIKVTSVVLENGSEFGVSTLSGENGFLTIQTTKDGVVETHITNMAFVAKL